MGKCQAKRNRPTSWSGRTSTRLLYVWIRGSVRSLDSDFSQRITRIRSGHLILLLNFEIYSKYVFTSSQEFTLPGRNSYFIFVLILYRWTNGFQATVRKFAVVVAVGGWVGVVKSPCLSRPGHRQNGLFFFEFSRSIPSWGCHGGVTRSSTEKGFPNSQTIGRQS